MGLICGVNVEKELAKKGVQKSEVYKAAPEEKKNLQYFSGKISYIQKNTSLGILFARKLWKI